MNIKFNKIIVMLFYICFAVFSSAKQRNQLTAYVEKNHIKAGEPISFTVEYSGSEDAEPDFSLVEKEFTIISRQTSTQSSFFNGNFSSKTIYTLKLLPKSFEKNLTIPSVKLGAFSTDPLKITQSEKPLDDKTDDINFLVFANKDEVYIDAQLILTLEIKSRFSLRNGGLSPLEIKDAIIEPLGEDQNKEVVEGGIRYHLFKRRYAVFPSKAGTLIIPSMIFKGVATTKNSQHRFPGFFQSGLQVVKRSKELKIKVKDVPMEFPKDQPFLPLKNLTVTESLDEPNKKLAVNKATTRRFELKGHETLASFLPVISANRIENLQIYSETGNKTQKKLEDQIVSSVEFSHVYMPTKGGQLTIPKQIIYWWDTEQDKLQTTTISELRLDVERGAAVMATDEKSHHQDSKEKKPQPVQVKAQQRILWPILAIVFFLLWFSTIVVVWFIYRKKTTDKKLAIKDEFSNFVNNICMACSKNDPKKVYGELQSFYVWLKNQNRSDLLNDSLAKRTTQLEKSLYDSSNDLNVDEVLQEIKKMVQKINLNKKSGKYLSPLYPN